MGSSEHVEEVGKGCDIARLRSVAEEKAYGGAAGFTWCMLLVVTLEILQLRTSQFEARNWMESTTVIDRQLWWTHARPTQAHRHAPPRPS